LLARSRSSRAGAGVPGPPRFLLADEPLAALDPRHVAQTLRAFRSLAETGIGVVVVLHDLSAARWIADEAVLLEEGGAVRDVGPVERVLTPRILEPIFGIPFDEAEVHGRAPGLVPRMPMRSDGAVDPGARR
jgi:iron complex transport system ATP-binding protein